MSKMFVVLAGGPIANCPHCGCRPQVMGWYIRGIPNTLNYAVICPNCGCRLRQPRKFNNPLKALRFWNESILIKGEKT